MGGEPRLTLLQRLQLLAGFESHGFARRDGHFSASARVTPDSRFARPDIEDAEASQLDAFAMGQGPLHALEDSLDGHLGLCLGYPRFVDHFINDIELDHVSPRFYIALNAIGMLRDAGLD